MQQLQPSSILAQTNPIETPLNTTGAETLPPLTKDSSVDDILNKMAECNQTWQSLAIAYKTIFVSPDPNFVDQIYTHEFKLGNINEARLEIRSATGSLIQTWISNGSQSMTLDNINKTYTVMGLPSSGITAEMVEFKSFDPKGLTMPSGLNEFVFPMSLVPSLNRLQIGEKSIQNLTILGMEKVQSRSAILLERLIKSKDDPDKVSKHHQYWIDTETGIIIRVVVINPQTGNPDQLFEITNFELNPTFNKQSFELTPSPDFVQIYPLQD